MVNLYPFCGKFPEIGEDCFLAPNSAVIGDVKLGRGVSVWLGAVVRGDVQPITVGDYTNIQDGVVLHGANGNVGGLRGSYPVVIGSNVTIGHNAVVHACTVGDGCLIGMGSVILDGAVIGRGCIIAAGAVVTGGTVIPDFSTVAGVPAKVIKKLDESTFERRISHSMRYHELAMQYK